jgi:hypothetical protein
MMDAQAQDRAHRIGQKKEVRVFRLLTNSPVEERILARATDKRNLNGLVVEAGHFSARNGSANAAAAQEKKEMMETLLKEWSEGASMSSDGGDGEEGVGAGAGAGAGGGGGSSSCGGTNGGVGGEGTGKSALEAMEQAEDDQLNEMMASSDAELQLYQAMDVQYAKQRAERWSTMHAALQKQRQYHAGNSGSAAVTAAAAAIAPPLPPRLMDAQEIPMWLTEDCWPTKYSVIMRDMMSVSTVAVGTRQGLVAKIPKKKGRRKNSEIALEMQQMQQYGVDDGEDDVEEEELPEEDPDAHVVAGKVMRKRKEVTYDDGMTDLQYSRYCEKQQDAVESKQIAMKEKKLDKLDGTIFKDLVDVLNALQRIKREDGSFLASIFVDKPPKIYYPDYYQIIQQPIALKQLLMKLRKMDYSYFEELELDFALMTHNARTYNLDTSPIFFDGEALRREFYARCKPILHKYGVRDADTIEFTELPESGHRIYPLDYAYRCVLSREVAEWAIGSSNGGGGGGEEGSEDDEEEEGGRKRGAREEGEDYGSEAGGAGITGGGGGTSAAPGTAPKKRGPKVGSKKTPSSTGGAKVGRKRSAGAAVAFADGSADGEYLYAGGDNGATPFVSAGPIKKKARQSMGAATTTTTTSAGGLGGGGSSSSNGMSFSIKKRKQEELEEGEESDDQEPLVLSLSFNRRKTMG